MNHPRTRRALSLLLTVLFCLSLPACSTLPPEERFDAFLAELPAWFIEGSDFSLNYLFRTPEDYGITQEDYELDFLTQADYNESAKEIDTLLKELRKFPLKKLTAEQQLTYRTLEDYLTRNRRLCDYYYLDNSSLGISLGIQSELPFLLADYDIRRQEDLDGYFSLLRSLDGAFQEYAAFEQERIDQGCGLCQDMIDGIVRQCENLSGEGGQFIIDSFNAQIEAADFLSDAEKQAAITDHQTLIADALLPAYRNLAQAMENLTGAGEPLGLAYAEDGQAYYEALVQAAVGTDSTIEELRSLLMDEVDNAYLALQAIAAQDPDIDLSEPADYGSFPTAEAAIDYLAQATAQDFPALPQLRYVVKQVPEALKENFAPAAYLSEQIDTPLSEPQTIYLNGDYTPGLFPTIAHEGYPGHLYQSTYYKSLQAPTVRYLIDYGGYTEGWATYVELMAPQYAAGDSAINELEALFSHISLLYSALFDIGIHYDGWTLDQFTENFGELFDTTDSEGALETYLYILESPGNYLRYCCGGLLFRQLRTRAEEALGSRFDPTAFHKVLLDAGPTSFPILSGLVDQYIETAQSAS